MADEFSHYLLIEADAIESLGRLRLVSGVEAAFEADRLWVRSGTLEKTLEPLWMAIPAIERYTAADGYLVRTRETVPSRVVPELEWRPLADVLTVQLPSAALSASSVQRIELGLRPSANLQPAAALCLPLHQLAEWGTEVARIRLAPLKYAVSSQGEAIAIGTPLPPLPGERLWDNDGILISAGFELSPAIDSAAARELIGHEAGGWILWRDGTRTECISAANLQSMTRSSLRLSLAAMINS